MTQQEPPTAYIIRSTSTAPPFLFQRTNSLFAALVWDRLTVGGVETSGSRLPVPALAESGLQEKLSKREAVRQAANPIRLRYLDGHPIGSGR